MDSTPCEPMYASSGSESCHSRPHQVISPAMDVYQYVPDWLNGMQGWESTGSNYNLHIPLGPWDDKGEWIPTQRPGMKLTHSVD